MKRHYLKSQTLYELVRAGARIFSSIQVLNVERMFQLGLKHAYKELGSQAYLSFIWQVLPLHSKGIGESHQKM